MSSHGPEFDPAMTADEPLQPFDVMETSSRQGMMKLIIIAAILLGLAFIVLKLYQPGVRDRGDPPLITAENTPFKVPVDDPGGLQTPDQDKEVFEVMSGRETDPDVVTLPTPEVPIDVPQSQTQTTDTDTPPPADTSSETEVTQQAEQSQPEPVVEAPQQTVVQPVPREPVATSSDWVVQIASLRSQAEADQTYARVQSQYGSILSGYSADIRRVDLAEKGIYYRARATGFADRDEANSVCNRLKAAGQACFVTRR